MLKQIIRNSIVIIVVVIILTASITTPALAIAMPDSGPFILQLDAYRHCIESDDILIIGRYNWPYSIGPPDTAPTETITQAVFTRLLSGATETARSTIYAYYRRGWGYGTFSMYLTAGEAVGLWNTSLTVELRGSPTLSWTGATTNLATTSVINWHSATSQTATQALMYSNLISWASTLGDYWSVSLVSQYAGGDKLSSYGEAYFTSVLPGLRVIAPSLFASSIEVPVYTDIDYSTNSSDQAKSAWPFNFGGLSQYFGLPSSDEVLRTVIAFVIIFVVCSVMVNSGVPATYALFGGFALMFVLTVPGFISRVIVGGVVFVVVLLTGLVFLLRRN